MIIIDSSKYISWMRKGRNPVALLSNHLKTNDVASCGIVRLEVIRGLVNRTTKSYMEEFFALVPEVPLTPVLLDDAAETIWSLDRAGIVIPLTDVLIGVCARAIGAILVTEDPHFRRIPGVRTASDLPAVGT